MLHMFDAMIKPILVYGSDAWGTNKATHLASYILLDVSFV